ncbi:exopolysaccharide biosynthesis polyprenyl glycosylphosphotransferase [Methylobacterium oryzihabitans]|uniref:Exopolysaccharide biosynthesis polyprenyl glycosylphosphotransferase n=1 Tax=Methylobacterium oryzihabitans TaxID=2499852 RepID=A0A437P5L2_9HYPH|nr:exopolysaccharide biosynthesis polyprenyl glycosylphosphotransferase [Methylobacterium oryzihabitans]
MTTPSQATASSSSQADHAAVAGFGGGLAVAGVGRVDAKVALDFAAALFGLVMIAPFLIIVAVAIVLDSKGPVFFRQTRTGIDGKPFKIFKFRTMRVQEDGHVVTQAKVGDSRVTRVGRFLRKTSIDELPQLINVLRGEMSLVGPRPHALAHDQLYGREIPAYKERFAVRPGLTGWAQVQGSRGETPTTADMERRITLDLWYIENRSLLLDIQIILRTVWTEIARKTNAY